MSRLLIFSFVLILSTAHAQKNETIEGKWKLISFSDMEKVYDGDHMENGKENSIEMPADSNILAQLGEVIYIFSGDKKFLINQKGILTEEGTYTIDYKSSKIVLISYKSAKGYKEQIVFKLKENKLTLLIPENSSTLKLVFQKTD